MDIEQRLASLSRLAGRLEKTVGDPAQPGREAVAEARFARDLQGRYGSGSWTFRADAAASIWVINDAADQDPHKILGRGGEGARPLLEFDPDRAWLRYELAGEGKFGTRAARGAGQLQLSGKEAVAMGAYLPAPRDQGLGEAIREQLQDWPWILSAAEVARLQPGQAVFLSIGGDLAASLTLTWADLFTGPLGALRGLAPRGADIMLDHRGDASIRFALRLSDAFRLVLVGLGRGKLRVALQRDASAAFDLDADAEISVGFQDPRQVRGILASVTGQLFDLPRATLQQVEQALDRALRIYDQAYQRIVAILGEGAERALAAMDGLGAATALARLARLQRILDEVDALAPAFAKRLGVPVARATEAIETLRALPARLADEVQDALDELLAKLGLERMLKDAQAANRAVLARLAAVENAVLDVARERVRLGASFEYRRVATGALLFEAELDSGHRLFARHHGDLLALDLNRLLAAAEAGDGGVRLLDFLHQRRQRREWTLGLSLGSIGSRLNAQRGWSEVERRLPDGAGGVRRQYQVSLNGQRAYSDHYFGGARVAYRGELAADFSGLSLDRGAWRLRLSLGWEQQLGRATEEWLATVADHAELWGVIGAGQAGDLLRRLRDDHGATGRPVRAAAALTFGNRAFALPAFAHPAAGEGRSWLRSWAEVGDAAVATALAQALPCWPAHPARASVTARAEAYAPLTALWLRQPTGASANLGDYTRAAERRLRDVDPELARIEGKPPDSSGLVRPRSFAAVARNSDVGAALRQLREAGGLLARAMASGRADRDARRLFEEALAGWDRSWSAPFALRWQGALLRELCRRTDVPANAITAVMRIRIGSGKDVTELVVAPS